MELRCVITERGPALKGMAPSIIQKGLDSAMNEAVSFLTTKVKDIIEAEGRMGVGSSSKGEQSGLKASIMGDVVNKGTPLITGIVGTAKPYGEVIEKGRRPGQKMPPLGVLLDWIALKMGVTGKEAKREEYLLRRSIGKKGFEGIHMFERAFTGNVSEIQRMFEKAGFSIAERLSGEGTAS